MGVVSGVRGQLGAAWLLRAAAKPRQGVWVVEKKGEEYRFGEGGSVGGGDERGSEDVSEMAHAMSL